MRNGSRSLPKHFGQIRQCALNNSRCMWARRLSHFSNSCRLVRSRCLDIGGWFFMAKNFQMNDYVNYMSKSKPISDCIQFHHFGSPSLSSGLQSGGNVCYAAMVMRAEAKKNRKGFGGGGFSGAHGAENSHIIMTFFASPEILKFCIESSRQHDYHLPGISAAHKIRLLSLHELM